MAGWRYPLFAVVAGDDKLADAKAAEAMLTSIDGNLLRYSYQLKNYHENFNESNREEIFADILDWMRPRIAS
jgi:alpha-beta hydrolase superfamily lysophospholipase